jgi:hypothetical protein
MSAFRHLPPLTTTSSTTAHRIAVSNVAVSCYITRHGTPMTLAIMNDNARRNGRLQFGAIGGGALITPLGMEALQAVAPISFEPHDDGVQFDARMTLRSEGIEQRSRRALEMLIGWARTGKRDHIELDITRELVEELHEDGPSILTLHDVMSIQSRLIGWKLGTPRQSSRGEPGVTTTPLYFCHQLIFEDARVFARMLGDMEGRVRRINDAELATTLGGTREGSAEDGHALFSNVFDKSNVHPF